MSIENWVWQGHAGHYCCANRCLFRLNTVVGNKKKYLISSVGELFMDLNNISLERMEEVGCGRKYESFVFETSEDSKCTCGCGEYLPSNLTEIDSIFANDCKTAQVNHMELCYKWDKLGE